MKKLKVGVVFGGRSGEHEVSLVSAASVIKALSPEKYEVAEIGITFGGEWLTGQNCLESFRSGRLENLESISLPTNNPLPFADIIFPVLHGPYGEDGTIQGLLEMLKIPYVGCGVLASSTAMDKLQSKAIFFAAGLPVCPYLGFTRVEWEKEPEKILKRINDELGISCFIKPANMGSSVGISKVKNPGELKPAIDLAAKFDRRILAEKAINAREIECAVLGNDDPIAAPLGEIIVGGEFYDFNDKYVNGVSRAEIPAKLDSVTAVKIQKISIEAYKALDCSGLARVDSFVDRDSGEIFINEINTMPGFTSISMYPKMMLENGISYEELVDRLIGFGMERFKDKQKNQIKFDSGSEWFRKI
ncbi:D-alanine--D-alanine ligase [Candidatus Peregrinibacteria bacterium]|nr:D-alanine--D-alanine ligase [Candidatus Peregrinibacteria bacterium]